MKRRKTEDLNAWIDVEKMNMAYYLISKEFPDVIRNTYLRGKTEFRDLLYERMGVSFLEAEILVDALEKNRKVEFRRSRRKMRQGTWTIL